MWIRAWVDETEMGRLHPDQAARIVFRSEPERSFPGHVARLGREADRETREFVVDVLADSLPENWAVGQRAEVYIETARAADVLTVPTRAIVWRDGEAGAFVEQSGHAAWRKLQLGLRGAEVVEVLEGLSESERIVFPRDAAGKMRDGQRVKVR
jgi:HlyD family secretion protein